jgi:hypothetical protein
LYYAITFKCDENFKGIDLKLGRTECRVYHNFLLESNPQFKFDCLSQLHTLDMTENDKDRFSKCIKMLKCSDVNGVDGNTNYNY